MRVCVPFLARTAALGLASLGLCASPAGAGGMSQSLLSPSLLGVAPGMFAPPSRAVARPPASRPAPPLPRSRARVSASQRVTALRTDATPSLQPETFAATARASERYAAIVDAGGWPSVPAAVRPGARGAAVALLRHRLVMEGDLAAEHASGEIWDEALAAAVRSFQGRHGLRRDGVVAGATLREMNVPAAQRFRQLASTAQRIAALSFDFGDRYVVANIPSASVEAVENGVVARRFAAVVGDVKHPSPSLTTRAVAVNLNPTWTLPVSIVRNEIIPKMRRDPNYLRRARMHVLDASGAQVDPARIDWSGAQATRYTLRQTSGAHNALGAVRINMPNTESVYMHDTPARKRFADDFRFLSHGCVRVEHAEDLAAWLLNGQDRWTKARISRTVKSGRATNIPLSQPVPVAWVYMTGWASADGVVHFRNDVYGYDHVGGSRTAVR